jgi:hypothetical protein
VSAVNRRSVLMAIVMSPLVPVIASCGQGQSSGSTSSGSASSGSSGASRSLVFDPKAYTTKTKTVSTSAGDTKVTYHFYSAITYCAKPVDATYQTLNVSVPVSIDGKAVEATNAPILLDLNIGGYMSSSVSGGSTGSGGMPGGGMPPPGMPPPGGSNGGVASGSGAMTGGGQAVSNGDLALAAGYVVVSPGARGRDNVTSAGKYYGKAPAAIVDLKAAVRYVRANKGRIPGNTDWIVSSGNSAGGALSALLGASGDSPLYDTYLTAIGAADASDAIFASGGWCPFTDLEHADLMYEWMFGDAKLQSGSVADQTVSKQLQAQFPAYQASLALHGADGFGQLTADTYGSYLVQRYLQPSATTYLKGLTSSARTAYLAQNPWITWSGSTATFTFPTFVQHVGRSKDVPAFDNLNLTAAGNIEFGNETTNARHFTLYSLRRATGNSSAQLDGDLPEKLNLMNPMYFIGRKNPGRAKNWWIRVGTRDTETALTVAANLATGLENLGDNVNARMYWDAGHGTNQDPADFITWIARITGHAK